MQQWRTQKMLWQTYTDHGLPASGSQYRLIQLTNKKQCWKLQHRSGMQLYAFQYTQNCKNKIPQIVKQFKNELCILAFPKGMVKKLSLIKKQSEINLSHVQSSKPSYTPGSAFQDDYGKSLCYVPWFAKAIAQWSVITQICIHRLLCDVA